MPDTQTKFHPGRVVATPAALDAIAAAGQTPMDFLAQHVQGDWGIVDEHDWAANDQSLCDGSRVISAYHTLKGCKLWIITEAADNDGRRLATTLLLPEEY